MDLKKYAKPITINGISSKSIIYKAKESKEIHEDLDKLSKLNEPTTKNDLGVDAISRQAVIDELKRYFHDGYYQRTSIQDCRDCFIEDVLNYLPSVTPQEPSDVFAVGDEVKDRYGTIEVITRVNGTYAEVMQADGRTFSVGFKTLKHTGRRHPEIAQVMQKMQEEE